MTNAVCSIVAENYYQILKAKQFSAPTPWVGVYVAAASLVCTLAMTADVFHGFRHRKLWFPCKFFTLNAASLTVIAVAMKLPVDLSNPMPRTVDQGAKLSSSAFLCVIMANLMPSLGSMNSSDLLMNVTALGIFVITVIVNIYIQISTGVICDDEHILFDICLLYLLILLTFSSFMVPISKKILEDKYLEMHILAQDDEFGKSCTVEKLKEDVSKYWIMAETSNPQFVVACSPTCSASGAIAIFVSFYIVVTLIDPYVFALPLNYSGIGESDYKWSALPILLIQSVGVVVGTIAPFFRLFRAFSFKLSLKQSKKYLQVYKIENYWIQALIELKSSRIPLRIGSLKFQKSVHELRNLILNALIGIQIVIVVISNTTQLITISPVIMFSNCWFGCKWLTRKLMASLCASKNHKGSESEHHDSAMADLSPYVLQLQDEVELANKTLKDIFEAVQKLIQEAEKKHPSNLMKLIEKSTGFEGVAKFENGQVLPLHSLQHPNSWSLVVVTLASIVIALRKAKNDTGDCHLRGISEGLRLVRLIEESLDPTEQHLINVRKAANKVWLQVELYHRWMDEDLQNKALSGKTSVEILQWLRNTAEKILMKCKKSTHVGPADSSFVKVVAANSMYRISQSILLDNERSEGRTDEMLFDKLSIMIADIFCACLSNIQRVIAKNCDATEIGKREANVKTAARLVGQTKKIMKFLEQRELPSLDPDKLGNIDEWHAYLNNQIPSGATCSFNSETVSSSSSQLLTIGVE